MFKNIEFPKMQFAFFKANQSNANHNAKVQKVAMQMSQETITLCRTTA